MKFEKKLKKLVDKNKLSTKTGTKLYNAHIYEILELSWALRVALDRYDMDRVNRAEEILAKYEDHVNG